MKLMDRKQRQLLLGGFCTGETAHTPNGRLYGETPPTSLSQACFNCKFQNQFSRILLMFSGITNSAFQPSKFQLRAMRWPFLMEMLSSSKILLCKSPPRARSMTSQHLFSWSSPWAPNTRSPKTTIVLIKASSGFKSY